MNCIILAAGYGTRLQKELLEGHPLKEYPKALLPIGNSCILDSLLQWLAKDIKKTIIVTNNLYYDKFEKHLKGKEIEIINDRTSKPEERLGAIGDLLLVLDRMDEDDFVMLASDVQFNATFEEIKKMFEEKKSSIHLCYTEEGERIKQKGVLELNDEGRIINFEEKPEKPKTRIAATPVYFIRKEAIKHIREYAQLHPKQLDRPGDMIGYLVKQTRWHAFIAKKPPTDIVGLQTYNEMIKASRT